MFFCQFTVIILLLHSSCVCFYLFLMWVLSTGCSPSGAECSRMGPLWSHRSCWKPAPAQTSIVSQPPPGIQLFLWGGLRGLEVDLCSTVDLSVGCRATAASPWLLAQAKGGSHLWGGKHLLPLPLH